MNQEDKDILDRKPYSTYFYIGLIVFAVGISCYMINTITVEQAIVPAPCHLIMSDAPLPDNVLTKGYDILRDNTGEMMNQKDDSISYNCYYIKDSGVIERTYRGWTLTSL